MIIATNNKGKLREIKSIFKDYETYSLREKGIDIEVEEDADSFYGNALKKAKEIYKVSKEPVIADDSGICITALNDFPGVLSHRFLSEDATDEQINEELIKRTNAVESRDAKIVCVLVYYDGKNTLVGEGILKGTITKSPRGGNGFGFDSIFELANGKTIAEHTNEEKNKMSARYLAAVELEKKLKNLN